MTEPAWVTKLRHSTILVGVLPWLLLVATVLMMSSGGWQWNRLGAGLVVAAAAMLSGGVIGFVFGVPRTRNSDDAGYAGDGVFANTNLEQISDWLTKILIGVGLTQFSAIGHAAGDLVTRLAPAFGGPPKGEAFAGGLVLFSVTFGFITGWLQARLKLGPAMAVADSQMKAAFGRAVSLMEQAERAVSRGEPQKARQLTKEASFVIAEAAEMAASYETTRATMPSGTERTAEFDRLAENIRRMAQTASFNPAEVRELLTNGSIGDRIVALTVMGARPETFDLGGVLDAIDNPRSKNEQYRALIAAQSNAPSLDQAATRALRSAVERVLAVVGPNTARAGVAAAILAGLGDR